MQYNNSMKILPTHWQVSSIKHETHVAATSYTTPGRGFEYQWWKQWWCWSLDLYTPIIVIGESYCELVFTTGFLFQNLASQAVTLEVTC